MKKEKKFLSRKFLNKESGLACVQVSCDINDWIMDASLTIHDCNRSVNIDFSVYETKDFVKAMTKIDMLTLELLKLRQFMENNIEEYKTRNAAMIKRRNKTTVTSSLEEILGD